MAATGCKQRSRAIMQAAVTSWLQDGNLTVKLDFVLNPSRTALHITYNENKLKRTAARLARRLAARSCTAPRPVLYRPSPVSSSRCRPPPCLVVGDAVTPLRE
jgi:hypothetical protein